MPCGVYLTRLLVSGEHIYQDVTRRKRAQPIRHTKPLHAVPLPDILRAPTPGTPEATTTYEVDSLAGNKLATLQDGAPLTLELDADNVMIDLQRGRSR